jgi:hypothetical protein
LDPPPPLLNKIPLTPPPLLKFLDLPLLLIIRHREEGRGETEGGG